MTTHYKIVFRATWKTNMQIRNIFYASYANPVTFNSTIMQAYVEQIMNPVLSYLSGDLAFNGVAWSLWTGPADGVWWDDVNNKPKLNPPWGVETIHPVTLAGTGTGDDLPPQVAAFMYATTPTKHVIAKKYIGPITEASAGDGEIIAGFQTALESSRSSWLAGFQGGGGPAGTAEVWGYKKGFNPLTGGAIDIVVATNRRRKIGRGA